MSETTGPKPTEYERAFLLGTWEGVKGAAYNAVYEFCREFGWCDPEGNITTAGEKALNNG